LDTGGGILHEPLAFLFDGTNVDACFCRPQPLRQRSDSPGFSPENHPRPALPSANASAIFPVQMFGFKKPMSKTKTNSPAPETGEVIPVPAAPLTPEQIEELKSRAAKADENWDRLLRTTADFENFKKRAARERIEAAQYASFSLLQKLLPVLDNFEMALTAAQSAQGDKLASFQSGVVMIQQQLKNALVETGLEEIDAAGQPFDPALHEAVSQMETTDVPEDHVAQQLRKGYKIKDRLLRPATGFLATMTVASA
jgi:molecular chaperone GrpE